MRLSQILLLVYLMSIVVSVMGQFSPVATDNQLKSTLDSIVHRALAEFMTEPSRVGLSAGLYTNGSTYTYNYGVSDRNTSAQPTRYTMYEIASATKTFTATILANAILEKKVKATDDIRKYLKGGYPNLQYMERPIRLVHLTNLTSRLPNWLPDDPAPFADAPPDSMVSIFLLPAILD